MCSTVINFMQLIIFENRDQLSPLILQVIDANLQ